MMDSVLGQDQTLPVDINGSCRLPDSIDVGDFSSGSMTAPSFSEKMSPIKALTMKDYENQITALKKENFNLKLRIYFMEERMQQKCDDSTEDVFKTNIELKVELESMKREMAEKQELLVSASKALESLAGRESGEPQRVREQAQREMDALRDAFNKRLAELQQCLQTSEEEVEKMAAIAEQQKLKNIAMEKQLQALGLSSALHPIPSQVHDLQQALQEKDGIIEQLKITLQNQEAAVHQKNNADPVADAPSADSVRQLSALIAKKDQELEILRADLHQEKDKAQQSNQPGEVQRLESNNKLLTEELTLVKTTNANLSKTLDEAQNQNKHLSGKLEVNEQELDSEKKNALKRDKMIQGLTQVLREKEKEITELCHEIEDRDEALAKARDAAHKAQLKKYQGAEEHQNLLMAKQTELAQLQGEHHTKVLEAQKLQRSLGRKEQELADVQQAKKQLEAELDDLQQQKTKGDKAQNDLQNQLKKLSAEIGARECALEQQYQEMLDQTNRKLQALEVTITRLTSSLADKEQQLQEYMNMFRDFEHSRSPGGSDIMLTKLRERLKEKEKALEQALDEKFAAIEEKDNEIHQLQLCLREKERDLERLHNLLAHNEETINSFDSLIKEKDVELQHLANTLKNLQRSKQDVEENLSRSLREKDAIISQLQLSLQGKTKDMEQMADAMLSQSQSCTHDLAEQMGQRLKVTEAMLAEAVKARERLVADNESAVEGLLATISSKDQLLKESAEHYNHLLSKHTQEIQELRKQLCDRQHLLASAEKHHCATSAQESNLDTAELRALLAENKRLLHAQQRGEFVFETSQQEEPARVWELRQTIKIMQEKLEEREAELSRRNSEEDVENIPLPKKTVVILKKELAQKTEALNKALKRENELKIALTELQSLLNDLEAHSEGQAANIESLTATLTTKDEIIAVLHQQLRQRGDSRTDHTKDQVTVGGMERSPPSLPQRERTMIGGDSQLKALPNLTAVQQEREAMNKALRTEQQLYSSLVKTVKEQDSAQRLHALQLELTAVQLLRQQLEKSIQTNEELREAMETERHRAKLREGMDLVDPKELESMRHQLEDAQRWNTSLQARLGAIQNRGGGVGGAEDSGDTLSFIGDQTSYMSICVGEGQEESLSLLSAPELKQKVLELQDGVSRLQALNAELQNRLLLAERSEHKDDPVLANTSPWKQQLDKTQETKAIKRAQHSGQDKESQTDSQLGQMVDGSICSGQTREHAQSGGDAVDIWEADSGEKIVDTKTLKSLLADCGATSVSQLKGELLRLQSEMAELRGLLKEGQSAEAKEKESRDASGDSSDGREVRKTEQRAEVIAEQSDAACNERESQLSKGHSTSRKAKQHLTRYEDGVKSRLPVPVRLTKEVSSGWRTVVLQSQHDSDLPTSHDSLHLAIGPDRHPSSTDCDGPRSPDDSDSPGSTLGYAPYSSSAASGSDQRPDAGHTQHQADSSLFTQLELLHQECQEKETLINKLNEQLADWEELHAQLQEKDQLNRKYVEALQAAQSTIAYLTACSLDSQGGIGSSMGSGSAGSDAALHSRFMDLQKALQEKEKLNSQLIELLGMADKAITLLSSPPSASDSLAQVSDLCLDISAALQQVTPSSISPAGPEGSTNLLHGPSSGPKAADSHRKEEVEERHDNLGLFANMLSQKQTIEVLTDCLSAAESAAASLAAHCTCTFTHNDSSQTSPDLWVCLDRLQGALEARAELGGPMEPSGHQSATAAAERRGQQQQPQQELHYNLRLLYDVFGEQSQRVSDLQASLRQERGCGEVSGGLLPGVQVQLETLHKALREKKRACKSLEEKLASAQSIITVQNSAKTPLMEASLKAPAQEQDDKGVQVDLQDLGYETSGKSENDREESSSTDLEVGVKPSRSASSLPSLLKQDQATFSSTENLDSTSTTPYPSSPALSSPKVSLKSLQMYEDYGVSEDPHQLRSQVRELKTQLENQTRVILHMQSTLRRSSLSSDLLTCTSDNSAQKEEHGQGRSHRAGQLREKREGNSQAVKEKKSRANAETEKMNQSGEQLQHSRSASPARLDSLVQSQARELSQLRQQIKESRDLGALHRRQLEELSGALKDLLQAGRVDFYTGEAVKEQLDKSLGILDRVEGRLDRGNAHLDSESTAALELSDRLSKELQEKNRLIQSLQSQFRGPSPSSHHSSQSDLFHSDRATASCHSSLGTQGGSVLHGQRYPTEHPGVQQQVPPLGGAEGEGVPGQRDAVGRLQGLRRENGRLQEQLRGREELNATLRSELDLHRSIMAQSSAQQEEQEQEQEQGHDRDRDGSGPQAGGWKGEGDVASQQDASGKQTHVMNQDLLVEHLQEIRALRQRLEESIQINDRLREQLERRLAEVEKDPATNIFINGSEEHSQLVNEMRFLWGQNQALKEQLNLGSRDKQKENEKLRETLARRTAKLEQSRTDCDALRQENGRLQERLERSSLENTQLQEALHCNREELHRLQSEVTLQRQQLSDSQHLLRSLRVELQVYEKIKTDARTHNNESNEASPPAPQSGSVDLSELLSEIRHLRLQLERSIQTNTALRQRLEEQLLRGPNRSDTININYLRSSPDEGGRSPGREGFDSVRLSSQLHNEHTSILHEEKRHVQLEVDGDSLYSGSSNDSVWGAPSRLVPGHQLWASRNGRHILGLIEDYNALRKQISEGRRLSRSMDSQLQECVHALKQQGSNSKVVEQQHMKNLTSSTNTMQQVLEEAGRLLKLVWRVSLPAGTIAGDNNQQDELLKIEIARLKSRLSQQERMLSGAVKRLRSTNQLKEGMERVIIDQLALTHGVLKKARGNLETNYCTLFGLKGPSGGSHEGGSSQWPLEGSADPQHEHSLSPVSRQSDQHSDASEERTSDASSLRGY
ncbi:CDK5 regulatory subunit-associated protein 2 isoform X3 [Genypterus blacodes]|uniref:CDK5 regulatory subunit-associated protein 2 isoform X3 n=1 Tax=Genypterus blacodes TaxID=154954 RepID=UPI003F76F34F